MEEVPKGVPWWRVLFSYSIFESSDSAWSLMIVSSFFKPFLTELAEHTGYHGNTSALFGEAITVGALLYVLLAPLLGKAVDHTGSRQPYLRLFVPIVVVCTAFFPFATNIWIALGALVIAYVAGNGAFSVFNSMLPIVSSPGTIERDTAMTVGIGYIGGLICLVALPKLVGDTSTPIFISMAVIYLLFALPAMFVSRDFPRNPGVKLEIAEAYRSVAETFRVARSHKTVFRFLVADFFYENAVASVITLMGVYSTVVMGFAPSDLQMLFGPAIIVAALSAVLIFGPLTRRFGPKAAVLVDLSIWIVLFAAALAVRPGTELDLGSYHLTTKQLFSGLVAPLAGMGLAGVWTSSRVYLTAITPPAESGAIWSLYGLSGRSAAVVGDLTWALIIRFLGETLFGFQMAILALAGYVVVGFVLMLMLPDARPSADNFSGGHGMPSGTTTSA